MLGLSANVSVGITAILILFVAVATSTSNRIGSIVSTLTREFSYALSRLKQLGMPVIPVVGYDRWENKVYQLGLQSIPPPDGHYCLRLDTTAIDDVAEPDFFKERISEIIEGLDLDPTCCSVLIDFGDASNMSVNDLVTKANEVIGQLIPYGFHHYVTAGCSIPKTIDLAVKGHDSFSMVLRKEMLLWQALRVGYKDIILLYGDYCIRGPTTNDDIRSKYINGKIRHTVNQQTFVVRGHPFVDDHSAAQMYDLSTEVVNSHHYIGENFSWGDGRIKLCSAQGFMGGPTEWIAIDTNHHLAYVVHEVEEFERNLIVVVEKVV
jgi:Beta protein